MSSLSNNRGFKALKQAIKVQYMLSLKDDALKNYRRLMNEELSQPYISKSYAERSVNGMLEFLSNSNDPQFLEEIYLNAVKGLTKTGNERALTKANLKLAKLYLDTKQTDKAASVVTELSVALESEGSNDSTRGTSLLELYSIQIQLYGETGDTMKLKEYYNKALQVTTAIPHPRILGIIREYGGKMHMSESMYPLYCFLEDAGFQTANPSTIIVFRLTPEQWSFAREDFFESFKNYDETGAPQRIRVLRYYIMACLLSESGVDPFESQEIKPYLHMEEIDVMKKLVDIFESADIEQFNQLLRSHREDLASDTFIALFLDDIFQSIRCQSVLQIVKPYSSISMEFLAETLAVSKDEALKIVMLLILDDKLPQGRIDDETGTLQLRSAVSIESSFIPLCADPAVLKQAINNHLPTRYNESATEQRQMQEQQSVVHATTKSMTNDSQKPSLQRHAALVKWLEAAQQFHDSHHLRIQS